MGTKVLMPCHSTCWVFTFLVATALPWNSGIKILRGQVWGQGASKAVSHPRLHLTRSGSLSLNKTWCTSALCPWDVLSWETHMDALLKVPQAVYVCLTSRAGLAEVQEQLLSYWIYCALKNSLLNPELHLTLRVIKKWLLMWFTVRCLIALLRSGHCHKQHFILRISTLREWFQNESK